MFNHVRILDASQHTRTDDRLEVYRRFAGFSAVAKLYQDAAGKCAICGSERQGRNHSLDHCHATGKLRGILCNKCNSGLGFFRDRIDLLEKAIAYLVASR